ncbi:polar localization protein TipN [Phenylobacterium sp.]|uniref:polar localization protein TipN n=1 Tax=Phenylobacterium sp. TaxID=1871053 RepID=UPI0025F195D0|nr:polar localization protein TipN [Phenylobacterium sp.]
MKFSKRPQPMQFGSPDAEPQDGPQAVSGEGAASLGPQPFGSEAEAVGFRPLDPAHDGPMSIHGVRQHMIRHAPHAAAHPLLDLDATAPAGWPTWVIAVGVAALWALGPIAFAIGYRGNVAPLQSDPFAIAVFALLAIGPAAFVLGAAYMIRQGQTLAFEARRSKAMAEDMLSPALFAAARAGDVAHAVRDEISRAAGAADEARETLTALRDALAFETDKLTGATAQSVRTAQELATTLGRERSEMSGLAQTLDAQATRVADAVTQQARMVTEAAQVAETQIREAETTLAARAADLAAAAGEASDAARTAGEDLTRHIARLETAGTGVAEQVRAVEGGLSAQRMALVGLGQALKADHAAFAAGADAHAAKLGEFIAGARLSSAAMTEQATSGGAALRQLMADAALHFRDLAETAKAEREEFGQSTLQSLDAVSSAAGAQRAQLEAQTRAAIDALATAAEETRAAAARHAASAREQVDQLSEAAFSAGQKANQVFEARLEEARALVDQSSRLVDDAGEAAARRLEAGAASARTTLEELTAMMVELEQRAARLPAAARGQADQVRAAVTEGMDELMAQARRTAQEAEAIDVAFQDRVRRNFEMLSEAVKLMGVVASAHTAAPPAPALAAVPLAAIPLAPARRARAAPPAELDEPLELTTPVAPAQDPEQAAAAALADRIGLRNRIRLTPTATDKEFTAVFEAASGGSPPGATDAEDGEEGGEPWTWKDLLASLDGSDGEGERLEEVLGAELVRMGVDAEKLLPMARIEAIAAAVQTGDLDGAREVVRKLAPAATRRIARRLFTDDEVKRQTEVYVRRYKTLIDDAIGRDPEGFMLESLLGAEAGRIFLLLDAAAGDMI